MNSQHRKSTYCGWILTIKNTNHYILCYLYVERWILFMPESTEGISEGQTTAMSGENHWFTAVFKRFWRLKIDTFPECAVRNKQGASMTISSKLSTRSWRCYQAQIRGLPVKRQGAIWNKLKSFHSDMSDFWHKYMDSYGEMMVSSGIKTRALIVLWKGKMERSGDPMQRCRT